MEGYTLRDLERVFGMDHRTIVRRWIEPGLLVGRRWSGRGPHNGWLFDRATVDAFGRARSMTRYAHSGRELDALGPAKFRPEK